MKKVLCLLLLAALCSSASALLQISVHGEKDLGLVAVVPNSDLPLEIWTTARIAPTIEEVPGYQLVVEMADGTISGGVNNYASEPGIVIYDDINGAGFPAEATANGVWGTVLITGIIAEIPVDATIFGDIIFHCNIVGDTVVKLFTTVDFETWTLVDSVVIYSGAAPEPMTISLIGLGSLLLRRRK